MPTQRERELARARARRMAERRAVAARRRRLVTYIVSGVLVVAIVGVILGLSLSGGSSDKKTSTTGATSANVACGAKVPAAPAKQSFAKEPAITIDTKAKYVMKIDTSCGEIDVTMDAAKTPHTVNSFAFLASKHYFDGTKFHRLVTSPSLTVLQGGDPTGTGSGGPGYTIPDENLTGAKYPRGTIAMANTGQAHSGGSQFFLVDKASQLPPSYTPFGTITKGLDVLDTLIAIGNNGANGAGDGAPVKTIYLNSLTVTKI